MEETKKQVTLEEFIHINGYTLKEWNEAVCEVIHCSALKAKFDDPLLLALVTEWISNHVICLKSSSNLQ